MEEWGVSTIGKTQGRDPLIIIHCNKGSTSGTDSTPRTEGGDSLIYQH